MPPANQSNPFGSAEAYYAEHRPDYGDTAIRFLADQFDLDGDARVLDLGCGAGHIAVPLSAHAGEVVGMDPNEEMLRHARERAATAGRDDIEWVRGSDADLDEVAGPFRLTTMGRSFHWMDQEGTLDRLYRMTEPGGGVAILTDAEWLTRGRQDWQAEVYAVADEYVADLPERIDPADVEYDDPWDEKLAAFGFSDVDTAVFEFEREWTVDGVVGYVLSLSFCSPATLGDDRAAFEAALRERLHALGGEPFDQDVAVEVLTGRK